jgi:hypothetical protein
LAFVNTMGLKGVASGDMGFVCGAFGVKSSAEGLNGVEWGGGGVWFTT